MAADSFSHEDGDPTAGWVVPGDVHTHVWSREHLSAEFISDLARAWPGEAVDASYKAHALHARHAARSIVLAFDAPYSGFEVPDDFVARYVSRDPQRLIGFCSIDPTRRNIEEKITRAVEDLGLRGVKIAPTYQGFDPLSAKAFDLYEAIAKRKLPVVWHQGVTFVRKSILAYALPRDIDAVALKFPEMKIVIAHMGHPWIDECIAVIRKHPNVYADISALNPRPIQFRSALISAGEYKCGHKLLFGTDFPFSRTVDMLKLLKEWRGDPASPLVLVDVIDGILGRDPLEVLGL